VTEFNVLRELPSCYGARIVRTWFVISVVALTGCNALLGITDPSAGAPIDGQPDMTGMDGRDANPNRQLVSVTVETTNVALGKTQQLTAVANYDDNSHDPVTDQATWALVSGTAASVSATGLVSTIAEGTVQVSATFDGKVGVGDVIVGTKVADHVTIGVGDMTLMLQQEALIRAQLVFSDSTTQDITFSGSWTTDNLAILDPAFGDIETKTSGTATVTATDSVSGLSGSITVTVTTVPCHPVINEIQTGSAASAADEWVEVFNPCTTPFDVTGWTLDYRAANATGTTDTNQMVTLSGIIDSTDTRLFCGGSVVGPICDGGWASGFMQQNNGGVGLRSGPKDTGALVDAAAYGSVLPGHPFVEGTVGPALANGKVMARLPYDGHDQNNNLTDFLVITTPTPNALNFP